MIQVYAHLFLLGHKVAFEKVDNHSEKFENKYRVRAEGEPIFRAQHETYNYYKERLETLND